MGSILNIFMQRKIQIIIKQFDRLYLKKLISIIHSIILILLYIIY